MDYINGSTPKTIPAGKVLCHNHVAHLADTPSGTNGFRAWFDDEPPPEFVECSCGYAGLPHRALRGHAERWAEDHAGMLRRAQKALGGR
jgi:hypothetical protein